jgi:hypothetical protein
MLLTALMKFSPFGSAVLLDRKESKRRFRREGRILVETKTGTEMEMEVVVTDNEPSPNTQDVKNFVICTISRFLPALRVW